MYEAKLRELDRTRDKSIADAPAQYRLYLQNLEKQFVDKGDLKGVLAVQNESNRFAKAGCRDHQRSGLRAGGVAGRAEAPGWCAGFG
jgi:hypothetical protein